MQNDFEASTLTPQQCRWINAKQGFRLEVLSGRVWLTRSGDAEDRFLQAGDAINLSKGRVLIQSDIEPGSSHLEPVRYFLRPQNRVNLSRHLWKTSVSFFQGWLR